MNWASRSIGNKKAKHNGDLFEVQLARQARAHGWKYIKIPMGAKMVGPNKIIRVRTPFDFVFVKKGKAIFADAKSFNKKTITYSDLTHHQVQELMDMEDQDHKAGYIVHFRPAKQIVFFPASMLIALKSRTSYDHTEGFLMGNLDLINFDCLL